MPPNTNPLDMAQELKDQLKKPLLWTGCVTQMLRWGVREFIECGPGRSLKFMMGNYEHYIESPCEIIKPYDFTTNVLV